MPTYIDAYANTIDIRNGLDTDGLAGRADVVASAPPRLTETLTQTGPREHMRAAQSLVTASLHDSGAPAPASASNASGLQCGHELFALLNVAALGRGGDNQRASYNAEDLGQGILWGAAGATAGTAGGPIGAGLGGAAGFGAGVMSRNVTNLSNGLRDLWNERQRGAELDRQLQQRRR